MRPCPNGHAGCPHPQDDSFPEIEFIPEPKMVDWLRPSQLADTGLKAAIAATFGSYADKREVEAAISPYPPNAPEFFDFSAGRSDVWFDYVADLGDGFNPTYALAYLFARPSLAVAGNDLPAGEFLVLGGDQVYPTANRDAYQNKFIGPYRSALPWRPKAETRRIFAIPGNHDWYDGLTSFLRIFCQARDAAGKGARWIGAWQAAQRRSYFAIKLPGDWWLWAIDGQLESDMDKPQLEYFEDLGTWIGENQPGARMILVTPEPNWVYCGDAGAGKTCTLVAPERFNTLAHFERRYVRDKGLDVRMVIAGDLHHYVHYTRDDGKCHRITCGGGGAYLLATHQAAERLTITETPSAPPRNYARTDQSTYPTPAKSKALGLGVAAISIKNWTFGLFLGFIYLLFAWIVQSASRTNRFFGNSSLLENFRSPPFDFLGDWRWFMTALLFSPSAIMFAVVVLIGLWAFTWSQRGTKPRILSWIGAVHGALHLLLAVGLMWVAARLVPLPPASTWFNLLFIALMLLLGWIGGTTLFGLYIWLASVFTGGHTNEVYSSMAMEGYKHFLRFHAGPGGVEVYAVGLDDVPRKWKFNTARTCGEPFFEPDGAAINPQLIEKITMT